MAESRSKEFKKPIFLIAILLVVIVLFVMNRVRTNRNMNEAEQIAISEAATRFSGKTIDQEILTDQKFKDLKAIPKLELGNLGPDISEGELAQVNRRFSNPFKPFQ